MIPVDQEFTHDPENGIHGDCQRAVIASLLELPLTEVPHFLQEASGDSLKYWDKIQEFVGKYGYYYATVPARAGFAIYSGSNDEPLEFYHEISGPSPRGPFLHAVVAKDGVIVHDPHPSRAGLAGDSSAWEYSFLIMKKPPALGRR